MGDVIHDISAERERQINAEGWSPEHDDAHDRGELARAAACYAAPAAMPNRADDSAPYLWPWSGRWWKPKSRREDLIRAAALLVAEIERLDRAIAAKVQP